MKVIHKNKIYKKDELEKDIKDELLNAGIEEGSLVGCFISKPMKLIAMWLGIRAIGAIPVFIPAYFSNDMRREISHDLIMDYLIEDRGDELAICSSEKTRSLNFEANSVIFVSSATTGKPKVILRTGFQMNAEFMRYKEALDLKKTDVFLPIVPLYHAYGFMCCLYAAFMLDATIVVPGMVYPRTVIQLIEKYKVTIMYAVPGFYQRMLQWKGSRIPCCLRYAFSSSAPIKNELLSEFRKKYGFHITQQYGSTETGSLAISNAEDGENEFSVRFRGVEYKLEALIDNDTLFEILVDSSATTGTYIYSNKVQPMSAEGYHTMDFGNCINGKLIISGRMNDVINIAGKKISRLYIEKIIRRYSFLVWAEICCNNNMVICKYKLENREKIDDFIQFCKQELPLFALPQEFIWTEDMKKVTRWKDEFDV